MTNCTMGQALLQAGNIAGARRVAQDVLSKNPHHHDALSLLIDANFREAKFSEGLQIAQEWLSREPDNFDALGHVFRGQLHLRNENEAARIRDQIKQSSSDPRVAIAVDGIYCSVFAAGSREDRNNMALLRSVAPEFGELLGYESEFNSGQFSKAAEIARRAISKKPNEALSFSRLAYAEFWSGNMLRARQAAKEALRLDPSKSGVRNVIKGSNLALFPPLWVSLKLNRYLSALLGKIDLRVPFYLNFVVTFFVIHFLTSPFNALIVNHGNTSPSRLLGLATAFGFVALTGIVRPVKRGNGAAREELQMTNY